MISAITNKGALDFMVFKGKFNAPVFVLFLQRLLKETAILFSFRPFRRFPVQCFVTYNAGPFQGQGTVWNLPYRLATLGTGFCSTEFCWEYFQLRRAAHKSFPRPRSGSLATKTAVKIALAPPPPYIRGISCFSIYMHCNAVMIVNGFFMGLRL